MSLQQHLKQNPHRGEEVIITLSHTGDFSKNLKETSFVIKYLPEREIMDIDTFNQWIEELKSKEWQNTEELLNEISKTFYNMLLPLYVHISCHKAHDSGTVQQLDFVKKQPQFQMPHHLERYI